MSMAPDTRSPIPLPDYYAIRRETDTALAYQHLDLAPEPEVPSFALWVLGGGIVAFVGLFIWGIWL